MVKKFEFAGTGQTIDEIDQLRRRNAKLENHKRRRKEEQKLLEERLWFETLISNLSSQFVKISCDQIDETIDRTLFQIRDFFDAQACFFCTRSSGMSIDQPVHSSYAKNSYPILKTLEITTLFPWMSERIIRQQEYFSIINFEDLPREAILDKQNFQNLEIRSFMIVPIIIGTSLDCYMAFTNMNKKRLNGVTPSRLRLLVDILNKAVKRKISEDILLNSYIKINATKYQLQDESIYLQDEANLLGNYREIVGRSKVIKKVLRQIGQVASTDSAVLIMGETGTGKELIAKAIHNHSKRKDREMVIVNCASLPSALIENELFGREKGAYTGALTRQAGRFELAHGSTIFLDEIGDLSPKLQAKLLRILQDGEFERLGSTKTNRVDVRVITATNRNLINDVKEERFRKDLYYRLNVFPITVPPLRERTEDIPLLTWAFVNLFADKMGKKIRSIPNRTMEALLCHHWPGNVRELRNVIEQAIIISSGNILNVRIPKDMISESTRTITLEESDYLHILEVLEMTGWRVKGKQGAAEILGLKPSTLYSKMHKLGIPSRNERGDIST